MRRRINKYSVIYGLIIFVLCLIIESVIQLKFSYVFAISFVVGLFTGLLNLYITDIGLQKLEFSMVTKPKVFYSGLHIIKFLIYGLIMFLFAYMLGVYTAFTCAFGMLLHKIVIHYLYLIKDPKDDKNRQIDELNLPKSIKIKLKENNLEKVIDITNYNREQLSKFLTNEEIEIVIKSLKKYELFIKGELEAIIDDEISSV